MKRILALVLLSLSLHASAQDYVTLKQKADTLAQEKAYAKAVEAYRAAFVLDHSNSTDLYNAACSAALAGQNDQAFAWLQQTVKSAEFEAEEYQQDSDLSSLRNDPRWQALMNALAQKKAEIEKAYDKPLQQQLLKIFQSDQKERAQIQATQQKYGLDSKEVKALFEAMRKTDEANLVEIKAILDQHGWVGPNKVGPRANQTLFLVIQHSDLATQQKYLPMMREAVKNKNASASDLALLEDRVAIGEGKRQLYGSQLQSDSKGKMRLMPVADPDKLDQRRLAIGLPPIADYLKNWNMNWDLVEFKKAWDQEELAKNKAGK
ncbi:MAG: hypothetical protein RL748_352 [Pseudomonadota bacterium]|jgi:hypothetical protein